MWVAGAGPDDHQVEAVEAAVGVVLVPHHLAGHTEHAEDVPLRRLIGAGAQIELGADDPLLFGSRLAGQYATMRAAHELDDPTLAELARMSVRASRAPDDQEW